MIETTSNYRQLLANLEYLKQMALHLDEVVDFSITHEVSFIDCLIRLTNHEIDVREKNMIQSMVKVAGFPFLKEMSSFEFRFQPGINQQQIMDFISLRFIENQENIVFLGPSGAGKTHLATSIGIAAAKKRNSTYLIKCHQLIENLRKARTESRLESRLKHYSRYKLLIIDEIGYLPIDVAKAQNYSFSLSTVVMRRKALYSRLTSISRRGVKYFWTLK